MGKWILRFQITLACVLLLFCAAFAEGSQPALTIDTGTATLREVKTDGEQGSGAGDFSQEILIFKGKSVKLTEKLENAEASKKDKYTWESSDPAVATVKNGTVAGKDEGFTVITCTAVLEDGTELKASVRVAVEVGITSLSAKEKKVTVYTGNSLEPVQLTIKPDNATCRTFSWSSADESVATVDENGVITGIREGTTTVTAVSDELVDEKQKPKEVTVSVNVIQPAMEKASVSWDLKSDEIFESGTYLSGMDEPIMLQMGIRDLAIRELNGDRMEMTFIYQSSSDFVPTDEQIVKVVNAAKKNEIGAYYGYCVVDYYTGIDLETQNKFDVECTDEVIQEAPKTFTGPGDYRITLDMNVSYRLTVTWPSSYDGLCIGIFGHSVVFNSKNDENFWKGKVPFHDTDYYFTDHPEYSHFMKVSNQP